MLEKTLNFYWKQIIEILFDENEIVLSHLYCLVRVSQYLWIMLLVNFELYIKINILRLPKTFTILNKSCKLLTNYKRLSLKITRSRMNHFIWNPKDSDDTKSCKKSVTKDGQQNKIKLSLLWVTTILWRVFETSTWSKH